MITSVVRSNVYSVSDRRVIEGAEDTRASSRSDKVETTYRRLHYHSQWLHSHEKRVCWSDYNMYKHTTMLMLLMLLSLLLLRRAFGETLYVIRLHVGVVSPKLTWHCRLSIATKSVRKSLRRDDTDGHSEYEYASLMRTAQIDAAPSHNRLLRMSCDRGVVHRLHPPMHAADTTLTGTRHGDCLVACIAHWLDVVRRSHVRYRFWVCVRDDVDEALDHHRRQC